MSNDIEQEQEQEQVEVQVPKRNHQRRKWVAFGLVGVLAMGGAAYAYFTTTGSGTASTQAGTSTPLTFTSVVTPATGGLVPDGTPSDIVFTAHNTGTSAQLVDTIHLDTVDAFTDALHTTPAVGCDTTAFTVADVVATQTVPGGNTAITTHGSLDFADDATNQDPCKNAYLLLSFTSN
ncbi:MAG: hypothetical protein QOD69_1374 [Solirubrobacteraceae bacterium]|jgi:hypothetical protein|nr:hypothetical protein [Solirubrobacteraceae bacterium]